MLKTDPGNFLWSGTILLISSTSQKESQKKKKKERKQKDKKEKEKKEKKTGISLLSIRFFSRCFYLHVSFELEQFSPKRTEPCH